VNSGGGGGSAWYCNLRQWCRLPAGKGPQDESHHRLIVRNEGVQACHRSIPSPASCRTQLPLLHRLRHSAPCCRHQGREGGGRGLGFLAVGAEPFVRPAEAGDSMDLLYLLPENTRALLMAQGISRRDRERRAGLWSAAQPDVLGLGVHHGQRRQIPGCPADARPGARRAGRICKANG